jgi:hypothetical protein
MIIVITSGGLLLLVTFRSGIDEALEASTYSEEPSGTQSVPPAGPETTEPNTHSAPKAPLTGEPDKR